MQASLHDGKHLHVCNYNFELQQGHKHHAQMMEGCSYCRALIVNNF